jgi:hypothetical protein
MSRQRPCFAGELGLLGLFDLGQLMMLNRATGSLLVRSEGRKGCLVFTEGRLVNAVDDRMREGEEAAYRLFAWKSGTFEFRPGSAGDQVTIWEGTDAIMLEAARRMDEAAEQGEDDAAGLETARLRARQGTLEALRDVFHRVAAEARTLAPGGEGPGLDLRTLTRPGDRLIYRSGHPPCLRREGRWSEGGPTLVAADYQELRAGLVEASAPIAGSASDSRRLALTGGLAFMLDVVGFGSDEILCLRPIELAPPDPARLEGDLGCVDEIARMPQGLTLVGGADPDRCRELLVALLPRLVEDGEPLVLVSDDATYRLHEISHRVIRIAPLAARAALESLSPRTVAVDPSAGAALTLEDLEAVPRVVAGYAGVDPAALACLWIARIAGSRPNHCAIALGGQPLTVLVADPPTLEDGIPFSSWRLTDEERMMALRGDAAALAAGLSGESQVDLLPLLST